MNNKGQALIEFVLILPILLMIIFIIVDFGMIFSTKIELENNSVDIIDLINDDISVDKIMDIYNDTNINIREEDDYLTITITKDVDIITPGLDKILNDPFTIKIERVISNES